MENKQKKVYINIVNSLRKIIIEDGLKQGDKIPSERELSERLNVGRSSVREALRALELLGLIETRRGEGTFLKDFKNHQLIKLLGLFILDDPSTREDIIKTKTLLEKNMIQNIASLPNKSNLQSLLREAEGQTIQLFDKIMSLETNRLLYRIWEILKNYADGLKEEQIQTKEIAIKPLLNALIAGDKEAAIAIYEERGLL